MIVRCGGRRLRGGAHETDIGGEGGGDWSGRENFDGGVGGARGSMIDGGGGDGV